MGAIVIRTRYDVGTESAEVATSGLLSHSVIQYFIVLYHSTVYTFISIGGIPIFVDFMGCIKLKWRIQ
jgi:hypothetical protein